MRRIPYPSIEATSSDRSATPDRAQYGLASLCGTCANHDKAHGGHCQARPPQAIRKPLFTPGERTGPPCCHRSARQVKQRQQQLHPQLLASIIHACCWPNACRSSERRLPHRLRPQPRGSAAAVRPLRSATAGHGGQHSRRPPAVPQKKLAVDLSPITTS